MAAPDVPEKLKKKLVDDALMSFAVHRDGCAECLRHKYPMERLGESKGRLHGCEEGLRLFLEAVEAYKLMTGKRVVRLVES